MNILEQFFIQFVTDALEASEDMAKTREEADKTAKAIDKTGDETADLAKELAKTPPIADRLGDELKEADRVTTRLSGNMTGLATKLGAWVGGLLSVRGVISLVAGSYRDIIELGEKADRFNINVEGYNAFNQVVEDLGGNADKAERGLRRFADAISDAYGDAESAAGKALASMGVSAKDANGDLRDTEEVMLDIAGAIEGMDKAQAVGKLRDLGVVDPAIRQMIMEGRAGLTNRFGDERMKGLITNETVERVRKFKLAWDDLKDAIQGPINAIIGQWAPALTEFASRLQTLANATTKWIGEHKEFFKGLGVGITIVAGVLTAVFLPAIASVAVAVLAATWPILAIIAALALFAIAWEDVTAFLKGQPSLLGELVKRYQWVADAVKFVGDVLKALPDIARSTWEALSTGVGAFVRNARAGFDALWSVVEPVLSLIVGGFRLLWEIVRTIVGGFYMIFADVFSRIAPFFGPVLQEWGAKISAFGDLIATVVAFFADAWRTKVAAMIENVKTLIGWVRGLANIFNTAADALKGVNDRAGGGAGGRQARSNAAAGQGQLGAAGRAPINATTSTSVSNRAASSQTNVKIDKVEVKTNATDADGMARAAGGALKSELRRASANANDGVER